MPEDNLRQKSTRAAGVVGIAVLCSRVLGLVRELVFAAIFGAGRSLDAFLVAFRTPNLLRDLFAEGALSTAFVTTFSKKMATEGDEPAWRLASKMATLVAVFMSLVVIGGVLLAPLIVRALAPGFFLEPGKGELTVQLAQIMYPFILLVSLAALVMGMLNAKHVFGVPAMASSFFNIGSIAGGLAMSWWLAPEFIERSLELVLHPSAAALAATTAAPGAPQALVGLAIGTLIGGFLQLVVQIPSLWKVGYRFRPDFMWRDPGVRQVLTLMGPAVIAAGAVQVNVMVNGIFASYLGNGPVSWLQIAFRLMQLPLGIFGVAIATVTLPLVSRSAALGNTAEFRSILARGMRLALLLTIPSAIGLIFLAEPIISIIYQRGRFTAEMATQTAGALQFYAIGLVSYSALKVLTPAFYAIDKKNVPMLVSFLSIATNLLLNWIFTFRLGWGHRGLAFSTGLVATINFAILYALMRRHTHRLETRHMLATVCKLALAGAALALVCWGANEWLLAEWSDLRFLEKIVRLTGAIVAGAAVYFAIAWATGVEEMNDAMAMARRIARRK